MELGVFEQRLRALPGVLDCAVSAEGVAVVVHPEVDPRLIELHAQVLLAEAGDRRPLLVVGGMTVGPRVLPSGRRPPAAHRPRRTGHSPLSLLGFALLVLALLAVVPIAGRDAGSDRVASPPAAERATGRPAPGLGRVAVTDEVASPAPTPSVYEPVQLAVAVAEAPAPARQPVAAPAVEPVVVIAAPVPVAPVSLVVEQASTVMGKGRSKGRASVVPPGKLDPPGLRRGHRR